MTDNSVEKSNLNDHNIPKLRFPDFHDEWEENFLNKFFDNRNERNFEELEVLSVTINDGVLKRSELGSDRTNKDKKSMKHVLKGDLVYNPMFMWKGASGISSYEGITSADYVVLKSKENVNSEFFAHLFQTKNSLNKFKNFSQGSLLERLRLLYPQFSNIKMSAPSYKEQEKISIFLDYIDNKTFNLTQKLNQLNQFKKYLLQNIFAQKLRFDGFEEEWKTSKFENLFKFNVAGDMKKELFNEKCTKEFKYPLFANALEFDGLLGYYKEYKYEPKSITVTARGNVGHATVRNTKFNAVGRLIILTAKEELNVDFFSEYINSNVKVYIESTGVPQLTAPSLKINKLKYPSLEEQNKIASFLNEINKKISLIKDQISQMEDFKKGLLQSLFI